METGRNVLTQFSVDLVDIVYLVNRVRFGIIQLHLYL